jgi:hypothetical protein
MSYDREDKKRRFAEYVDKFEIGLDQAVALKNRLRYAKYLETHHEQNSASNRP